MHKGFSGFAALRRIATSENTRFGRTEVFCVILLENRRIYWHENYIIFMAERHWRKDIEAVLYGTYGRSDGIKDEG